MLRDMSTCACRHQRSPPKLLEQISLQERLPTGAPTDMPKSDGAPVALEVTDGSPTWGLPGSYTLQVYVRLYSRSRAGLL